MPRQAACGGRDRRHAGRSRVRPSRRFARQRLERASGLVTQTRRRRDRHRTTRAFRRSPTATPGELEAASRGLPRAPRAPSWDRSHPARFTQPRQCRPRPYDSRISTAVPDNQEEGPVGYPVFPVFSLAMNASERLLNDAAAGCVSNDLCRVAKAQLLQHVCPMSLNSGRTDRRAPRQSLCCSRPRPPAATLRARVRTAHRIDR